MNSVEKALAVMRVLSSPSGPHRLADIAERAQLNRPSAHRILQTLIENNYATTVDGSYSAGLAMRALGGEQSDDLVTEATPILNELQQSTGHTVHFAAFARQSGVYVAKFEGSKPYQMASRVGMQISLRHTSIGKSILAALPETEADELLLEELGTRGSSPADLSAIHQDLREVRDNGFALDDEENEPNIRCVGAVVRGANGRPIGGISVSGLAFVLEVPQLFALGTPVMTAAHAVSVCAGFTGTSPIQETAE